MWSDNWQDDESREPRGILFITAKMKCQKTKESSKPFEFEIDPGTGEDVWRFSCANAREREDWVRTLRSLVERLERLEELSKANNITRIFSAPSSLRDMLGAGSFSIGSYPGPGSPSGCFASRRGSLASRDGDRLSVGSYGGSSFAYANSYQVGTTSYASIF